jgi:excinuclease ABC subunit A
MSTQQTQIKPINKDIHGYDYVEVLGARVHNLKNIDVRFPRNKLVVITGLSGSGKSSLAFDTIYAEGQRRYIETFISYARSFIGDLERPDVDKINGLSPVIAIEQKTTSRNPRSTVGTVTEIYDYLRLLFAKVADAYSYTSGHKMVKQTAEQIEDHMLQAFSGKHLSLLAPVVKGRKGHYRELFQQISGMGFSKVRIDGEIKDIVPKLQVDRYKIHDIEIVIDRLIVDKEDKQRLQTSLYTTLHHGKGVAMVQDESGEIYYFSKSFMDPITGLSYDEPAPNTFSFNSPYGACATCEGLGTISQVDIDAIMPDKSLSIQQGGILPLGVESKNDIFKRIRNLFEQYKVPLDTPIQKLPQQLLDIILYGQRDIQPKTDIEERKHAFKPFEGVIPTLDITENKTTARERAVHESYRRDIICPECQGARLKKVSLYFKIADKNIAELANMNLQQLHDFLADLMPKLDSRQQIIASELLKELKKRIHFLLNVGLYYLSLNRPLRTLSGGEAQRIRLATQIGTQLVGVLYILDEPSIGLHQRDNVRLIQALHDLRDLGNSVMVVEHDRDMMLESDYIIDIGPGAGKNGGEVVAAGTPKEFLKQGSTTAEFLSGTRQIEIPTIRRQGNGKFLTLTGCTGNNLKDVTLKLSLGKLICITGVSGSGKSTLIHQTLYPILQKYLYKSYANPLPYTTITGLEHLDKVVEIDQKPIGRTPRSNPSTYTNVFAGIRNLFSQLPEAKIRGYQPGRFSFNVSGGRCETCQGGGMRVIEMDFLPDVYVHCEACQGKRYNRETLEVQYKGKSISDVLDMTISNAVEFFDKYPHIRKIIQILEDVGLGYLTLGQPATTLSGGEAQRVKLATELAKRDTGKTFYILDEPTTGLHFQDIQHLLDVLNKLTDKGNTVLIIEHNLDIIKVADYIIDIGPEGGEQGGQIIAEGTPEELIQHTCSYTAKFLKTEMQH